MTTTIVGRLAQSELERALDATAVEAARQRERNRRPVTPEESAAWLAGLGKLSPACGGTQRPERLVKALHMRPKERAGTPCRSASYPNYPGYANRSGRSAHKGDGTKKAGPVNVSKLPGGSKGKKGR